MKKTFREIAAFLFWWGLVLALCWGLAGLLGFVTWGMLRDGRRAARSTTWPTTQAQILSSSCGRSVGYRGLSTPDLDVRYRYVVAGQTFEGHRVTFSSPLSAGTCATLAAQYRPGLAAQVAHDPADPQLSVLQPGGGPSSFLAALAFGGSLVLAALSLFLTAFGLRVFARGLRGAEPRRPARRRARR